MNAAGPAIVLVLAVIGAARVLRLAWLTLRSSVRALGNALAFVGGKLGTIGTRERALTQADVDAACEAAVKRALASGKSKRPTTAPIVVETREEASGN